MVTLAILLAVFPAFVPAASADVAEQLQEATGGVADVFTGVAVPWTWDVSGVPGLSGTYTDIGVLAFSIVYISESEEHYSVFYQGALGQVNCGGVSNGPFGGTVSFGGVTVPCDAVAAGVSQIFRPNQPEELCEGDAGAWGHLGSITISGYGGGPGACNVW